MEKIPSSNPPEIFKSDLNKDQLPPKSDFSGLMSFIEPVQPLPDKEAIDKFKNNDDRLQRLESLYSMKVSECIECIENNLSLLAVEYLRQRLSVYQRAVSKENSPNDRFWSDEKQDFIPLGDDIFKKSLSPGEMNSAILCDIYYSHMLDSPEIAALKKATESINCDKEWPDCGIFSIVQLFCEGPEDISDIFTNYSSLISLYRQCQDSIKTQNPSSEEAQELAVSLMSDRLKAAYDYCGAIKVNKEFGDPDFWQAIDGGQLGKEIQWQMTYIRKNIDGGLLLIKNAGRFIGKSGDNKFTKEKQLIDRKVSFIDKNPGKEEISDFTLKENQIAVDELKEEYQARINSFYSKKNKEKSFLFDELAMKGITVGSIDGKDIFQKELLKRGQKIENRRMVVKDELENITLEYEREKNRLANRTFQELEQDLRKQKEVTDELYEENKSLAQKAFDLLFKLEGIIDRDKYRPSKGIIDWVGLIPFPAIAGVHEMMRQGVSDSEIIEYVMASVMSDLGNDDKQKVHNLVKASQERRMGKPESFFKVKEMIKAGCEFKNAGHELSFSEIETIAGKNFDGLDKALNFFNLDEVKFFLGQGVILGTAIAMKKAARKSEIELTAKEIAEVASYGNICNVINGGSLIEIGAENFNFYDLKRLLKENTDLSLAVQLLKAGRNNNCILKIEEIISISLAIQNMVSNYDYDEVLDDMCKDFAAALKEISIGQIIDIYNDKRSYEWFYEIKDVLAQNKYPVDFDSVKSVMSLLSDYDTYETLGEALKIYSLDEVGKITEKLTLAGMIDIHNKLVEKGYNLGLEEEMNFGLHSMSTYSNAYHIIEAIDNFGIEGVRRIVSGDGFMGEVLRLKEIMDGNADKISDIEITKILAFDGIGKSISEEDRNSAREEISKLAQQLRPADLEFMIHLSKIDYGIVKAMETIKRGFTVEEIIRFPFLVSELEGN